MSIRTYHRPRPQETPIENLLGRLLDPIDWLSEAIYSILIVLTFTLWVRIIKLGPNSTSELTAEFMSELVFAALGATLAWGIIDGIMYALMSMFQRGESHRVLDQIQMAGSEENAVDVIAGEFDYLLEPLTGERQRRELYKDVLEHLSDSRPQPVGFQREDLAGALGSVLVAVVAVLPSLAPLVLVRGNYELAIRISNWISFVMLFIAGFYWGRYTGASPWKTGLLLFFVGVIMMAIAIPLGG